jgi:hypothetical protein
MARRTCAAAAAITALAACSAGPSRPAPIAGSTLSLPEGTPAHMETRNLDARPRLTLVARDGDPRPAIVLAIATDAPPAATTALAAIVEARVKAAGFDVDTRTDRAAFRLRASLENATKLRGLLAAMADAMARPITAGAPELAVAKARVEALRRRALDGVELTPIAACTGMLGFSSTDAPLDLAATSGAHDLEVYRASALVVARASLAAVGPSAFCEEAAKALEQTQSWPAGAPAVDAWPASGDIGTYALATAGRTARVHVAVRVGDPVVASAAASRLAADDHPLTARLAAMPEGFRVVEVVGVARPRGGCVALTLEGDARSTASLEEGAAYAAAIARSEMAIELKQPAPQGFAARQVVSAGDPREAASRAAWWALSGADASAEERWSLALGAAQPTTDKFRAALDRSLSPARGALDRRVAVERGQGELWLLLGAPCGALEESQADAGSTALAIAAAASASIDGVTLEAFVASDGLGVIAHAAPRDEHESSADLARRIGNAAARALTTSAIAPDAFDHVRATTMDALDRSQGPRSAAFEAFATAASPDHPTWLDPLGLWARIATTDRDAARSHLRALATGPLRVAVLASADTAQAEAGALAIERWISPRAGEHGCRAAPASSARPGRYEARLPADGLAQALVGAQMPAIGAPGRDLAELAALALDGEAGLLARSLHEASSASARLYGGGRASALVVDVRAPSDAIGTASAEAKAVLTRLGASLTDADLARAVAAADRRRAAHRAEPRGRLADLWLHGAESAHPAPTLQALRDFLNGTLREGALIVVEARPQ